MMLETDRDWGPILRMRSFFPAFPALLPVLLLPACMPAAGPDASAIVATSEAAGATYQVVDVTPALAEALAAPPQASLSETFGQAGGAPDIRIGVGDTLVVTIFEAASGGLFSGSPGTLGEAAKSISMPPQPVSRAGTVSVPYVGAVQAAGRTPAEVQATIEAALQDKAIEPQVIVTVASPESTFVTVSGDVGASGRIPLSLGGDRLLDVIAAAGGATSGAYETQVRLTRGAQSATLPLARIVEDPGENVYLRPDDQVFVYKDAETYTVLGAAARNASVPFDAGRLTLAEVVGRSGGLVDDRADPDGVFVFRHEAPDLYAAAAQSQGHAAAIPAAAQPAGVPVVYRFDFQQPGALFAAQRFVMRDNDLVYVSNAPAADLQKFLSIIGSGLGTARTSTTVVNGTI